ncbi:hypothetical protein Tco_0466870, partial [Tanacetum coccineum]
KTSDVNAKKPKSINESVVSEPNVNKEKVIIEVWTSDDEDEVSDVQTVCHIKTKETQAVKQELIKLVKPLRNKVLDLRKLKLVLSIKVLTI